MTLGFNTIASGLAILLSVVSLLTLAVKEGERRQVSKQMKLDIARAHERIDKLETSTQHTEVTLKGMEKDIKYLVASVDEIKDAVKEHVREA